MTTKPDEDEPTWKDKQKAAMARLVEADRYYSVCICPVFFPDRCPVHQS